MSPGGWAGRRASGHTQQQTCISGDIGFPVEPTLHEAEQKHCVIFHPQTTLIVQSKEARWPAWAAKTRGHRVAELQTLASHSPRGWRADSRGSVQGPGQALQTPVFSPGLPGESGQELPCLPTLLRTTRPAAHL